MTTNTITDVAIAAIVPPLKAEESPLCRGNGERQRQWREHVLVGTKLRIQMRVF